MIAEVLGDRVFTDCKILYPVSLPSSRWALIKAMSGRVSSICRKVSRELLKTPDHGDAMPAAGQTIGNELSAHAVGIRDVNADRFA